MFTLTYKEKQITITTPVVMGIVNVTPDSFYSDSRKQTIDSTLLITEKMLEDGATLIDIGGQSTRPNSQIISVDEELRRVIPAIEAITKNFPQANISIDTYNAIVAENAVAAGAMMVNDISGGTLDKNMFTTVAALNVPYVCMHIKGSPQTMLQQANYNNVVEEVKVFFEERINTAKQMGIQQMIVDIGFGFAKTVEQNFELVKNLKEFKELQKPILLGVSRKSSIYKTLGVTAQEALNGTTILNTIGILNGANILRVHDVKEAVEVIKLANYFT
ncbi:MAG: dihydropteroate synthase [Chitinophagaceae bacterium]